MGAVPCLFLERRKTNLRSRSTSTSCSGVGSDNLLRDPDRGVSVQRSMSVAFWVNIVSPPSRYELDLVPSIFPFSHLDPEKVMQSEWKLSCLVWS